MSEIYVVLDQREDRINNAFFAVDMNGYNPRNPNATRWVDYPAHIHNNAGGVTLADSHAVIKKWVDPKGRQYPDLRVVAQKSRYPLATAPLAPPKPSRR